MQQLYILIKATISKGGIIDLYGPFMDAGGYCYAEVQFEEEEAYINAFRQHAGTATECHADIIILEAETNRICGFYPDGELFGSVQWDRRADRRYHARCKTRKAIYIPEELRPALPVSCSPDSFFFPPKSDYAPLDSVMAKMTGKNEYNSLVLFPPNNIVSNEVSIEDFETLLSEYDESSDCRLLPKLLCASQRALETEEDEFASYCTAYALLHLARPDMALETLDLLLKSDPEYVDALILRGICEMRLDQMAASIETLNKALSLQDEDIVRYYLGLAYAWHGYISISYRQFSSINDPYWKDVVEDILLEMEKDIPYVTGLSNNCNLPAAYPIPWTCLKRSTTVKDFHGRSQYVCFIREKGIQATPEERVRQEFLQYLVLDLGYPKSQVLVEESLTHMDRSLRERVDILVYFDEERRRRNLLMVECKAPNVLLDGVVGEQALKYNNILSAKYIILTNGNETQVYRMDEHKMKYVACISIPTYKQLMSDSGVKEVDQAQSPWIRPDYTSLSDSRIQQLYIDVHIGAGTDITLCPAILNLAFLFMDHKEMLSCPLAAPPFTIIKDMGLTDKAVGNPSGGRYQGTYRWFTVQDNRRHMFQVYMAVFANYSSSSEQYQGVEGCKSTLLVAVDRRGQPISVLQIDLDKHLRASDSGHELTHSGVRSRAKIEDLMPHIESQVPYLLGGMERITFGCLDTSKNLVMSDLQTAKVIANIISYSLIRFQLRETKPKKKVTTKR